jgi:hypothetical protein
MFESPDTVKKISQKKSLVADLTMLPNQPMSNLANSGSLSTVKINNIDFKKYSRTFSGQAIYYYETSSKGISMVFFGPDQTAVDKIMNTAKFVN